MKTEVLVWHGSIGEADADVLVNASNTRLWLGSGVSEAIGRSCGAGFQAALDERLATDHGGGLEPGVVVVTDAHQHRRAKYVAHVAVMDYREGADIAPRPDEARLRTGYRGVFEAVESLDDRPLSVAMVALGAGTGGFGLRQTVGLACEALTQHLQRVDSTRMGRVIFVAFDLLECANTLCTVRTFFDVDEGGMGEELRAMARLFDDPRPSE